MSLNKRKSCRQKRYMSKDEAFGAARRSWNTGKFLRAYKCMFCSGWHLARHKHRLEVLFDKIAGKV